jgi:hypothetical protein
VAQELEKFKMNKQMMGNYLDEEVQEANSSEEEGLEENLVMNAATNNSQEGSQPKS